jgi:hypothetical protein
MRLRKSYNKLIFGLLMCALIIYFSLHNSTSIKEGASIIGNVQALHRYLEKSKNVMSMYVSVPG